MRFLAGNLCLLLIAVAQNICAQQSGLSISVNMTSLCGVTCTDPSVGTVDLSDYVMYEVYLNLVSDEGCVYSILSADTSSEGPDCELDGLDVILDVPCGTFQHPLGTTFLSDNACDLINMFPCLEYDSFLTIGDQCELPDYAVTNLVSGCDLNFVDLFNGNGIDPFSGQGLIIDSGNLFAPGGVGPDDQGRVLIAHIVSCGELLFKTSAYFSADCVDAQSGVIVDSGELTIVQPQPCLAYPMTNHSNPLCQGAGSVTFYEGGYGYTNYSLYSSSDNEWIMDYPGIEGDLTITGLAPGEYYMSMTDSIGCCAISDVFVIPLPGEVLVPPQLDVSMLSEVSCYNANDGTVQLYTSSENGNVLLSYAWNGTSVVYVDEGIIGNLACGEYIFEVPPIYQTAIIQM